MAAIRIVVLLNLKEGKDPADYEAWARSVDLKTVNRLGSVERFSVFRTTGLLGSAEPPPYQYIEVLDVIDMDAFGQDVATVEMQRIAGEFQAWADPIFITTHDIEAAA